MKLSIFITSLHGILTEKNKFGIQNKSLEEVVGKIGGTFLTDGVI